MALGVLLLLTASPAQAAQIHVFSKSFTLPNSGTPLELAINQSTGKVYASDDRRRVVDVFEASGAPDPTHPTLTEADDTTTYNFSLPYGVAVDNTVAGLNHGDIYVADYNAGAVLQFSPSGARTAQAPITAANVPVAGTLQSGGLPAVLNNGGLRPTGLTVAPSGDVYVSDQTNYVVDVFEPSGVFVAQIGAGHLAGPYGLALDSHGNLYVAEYGVGLIEFASSGACVNSCTPIGANSLGVATDSEDNVYSDEVNTVTEFNSSAEPIESFGSFSFGRAVAVNDTSGAVYVADEPAGQIDVFKPVNVATLAIQPFTSTGPQSGTLTGEVDPAGGGNVTGCHFEYGIEKGKYSLGTLPCLSSADAEIGTPTNPIESPTEVHAVLTGLTTLTTYHYRLAATDAQGINHTPDHEVTPLPTLPAVRESSSSSETPTNANLAAEINPGFGNTVYRFQYGTTTSYGFSTPIGIVGSDGSDHPVTADIAGLAPGTIYHYRAVAINYVGTAHGPDRTLTTPDKPAVSGGVATDVTSSTATLGAEVNPKLATTTYHFQYGTGSSYGLSTPQSPSIGAAAAAHSVSASLSGLVPATTYHFRVVATNPFGAATGFDQTFTTAPAPPVTNPLAKRCGKDFVKRHGKCVKKPHRKAGQHKHGKPHRKAGHHKHGGER